MQKRGLEDCTHRGDLRKKTLVLFGKDEKCPMLLTAANYATI
jgi:hypothetical protein